VIEESTEDSPLVFAEGIILSVVGSNDLLIVGAVEIPFIGLTEICTLNSIEGKTDKIKLGWNVGMLEEPTLGLLNCGALVDGTKLGTICRKVLGSLECTELGMIERSSLDSLEASLVGEIVDDASGLDDGSVLGFT
jgi:hypothetical protein